MVNYFIALHEYDLEIRFHRRDLYWTSAFCGHVFTMKLMLNKINTWTHDRKRMWLPDAHLCYFILSAARPCVAVILHGAATSTAISPQMHQQNPADAPPESRGTTRIRRTPTESCLHLQREYSMNVEDCFISKICNGNSIMVNTVMLENYKVNCWDIWLLCNLIIICNGNSIMVNAVMLENYKVNCWDIWLLCNIDGPGPLCLARPTL